MRRAAQRDGNEAEIIKALRLAGCSVERLSGANLPDLLVGRASRNYLMEIKNPARTGKQRKLRPGQARWARLWRGLVAKVETVDQAYAVVGLSRPFCDEHGFNPAIGSAMLKRAFAPIAHPTAPDPFLEGKTRVSGYTKSLEWDASDAERPAR